MCLGMALRQQTPLAKDLDAFVSQPAEIHVKLTAALQSFDRALTIEGDNPRCFFERGIVLQMLGRHAEAIATFDAAAALQGDVHPRPLSGDANDASSLDKNDLAAHALAQLVHSSKGRFRLGKYSSRTSFRLGLGFRF